jgi:hypothetical protein
LQELRPLARKARSEKGTEGGGMSRVQVAVGYAELMGRFSLPLFLTQTFTQPGNRLVEGRRMWGSPFTHPEAVVKAHRYTCNLINVALHGNHWKRRGIDGVQSILGIEKHKSGQAHSHAVLGHPDIDLGSPDLSVLRRDIRNMCYEQWGIATLEVAKSPEHCNAYVAKYIVKDGEIYLSDKLSALNTGQLSILAAIASHPTGAPLTGSPCLALA